MRPSKRNPRAELAKRILDVTLSIGILFAFLPLLIAIAVWIRLDSPGPILYRGERVGRFGRRFYILKFRTMVVDADRRGPSSVSEDDERVTRAGRFLRRFKLDELPQLINVLRGEMSLVGPRPQVPWAVQLYTAEEQELLNARPGLTDWASIRFRNEAELLKGSADPDGDYLKKIAPLKHQLALQYVRQQSFRTDLRILAQTVRAVLSNRKHSQ